MLIGNWLQRVKAMSGVVVDRSQDGNDPMADDPACGGASLDICGRAAGKGYHGGWEEWDWRKGIASKGVNENV